MRVGFSSKLQLSMMPGKLKHDQFLVDKLGSFVWTDIFSFFTLSLFTPHFEFSLLCTPKWCKLEFSSKLQLPKMPGKL